MHYDPSDRRAFQAEFLREFPPPDPRAYHAAKRYHSVTAAYDRMVCCGSDLPQTSQQRRLINQFALALREELQQEFGVPWKEIRRELEGIYEREYRERARRGASRAEP